MVSMQGDRKQYIQGQSSSYYTLLKFGAEIFNMCETVRPTDCSVGRNMPSLPG